MIQTSTSNARDGRRGLCASGAYLQRSGRASMPQGSDRHIEDVAVVDSLCYVLLRAFPRSVQSAAPAHVVLLLSTT